MQCSYEGWAWVGRHRPHRLGGSSEEPASLVSWRGSRASHPVYGWFTEGFDTRDLKEAKVLLEELAS
jgi:hypothetical protein